MRLFSFFKKKDKSNYQPSISINGKVSRSPVPHFSWDSNEEYYPLNLNIGNGALILSLNKTSGCKVNKATYDFFHNYLRLEGKQETQIEVIFRVR